MTTALSLRPQLVVHGVRRFRAMNTSVEVRVADPAYTPLLARAERLFSDVEVRFSRFRPHSELSRLNRSGGGVVSPEMLALLQRARRLHQETGGVFDPCVLPALAAAGYDRSFEQVRDRGHMAVAQRPTATFADVMVDVAASRVTLPAGAMLDLGGIGKGYAVDRAAELLRPARHALVNAGGDIFALGTPGVGWPASVMHPLNGEVAGEINLRDEALATSTTAVRRWRAGGVEMHHLIDPRTGAPARTGVIAASVVAPEAVIADVYAKTALILGLDEGGALLMRRGYPGLFVLNGGGVVATPAWRERAAARRED
jgi:thiamine biosynthesis lipoprotein